MLDTNSLDYIACQQGTDKSTRSDLPPTSDGYDGRPKQGHGYTVFYEHYLSSLRPKSLRLLEIGVLDGKSLMTWKAYFPQAQLFGLDIDPACSRFEDDRTRIFVGSQADVQLLAHIGEQVPGGFDIIIDDGSHYVAHVIASFNGLFNYLKPGGIYVIEDLHIAAWADWGSVAFNRGMDLQREEQGNDIRKMSRFLASVRDRSDVADLAVYLKKICFICKVSRNRTEEHYPWQRGDPLEELFPPKGRKSLLRNIAIRLLGPC